MEINPGFVVKELIPRKQSAEWKKYRLAWEEYPKRDIVDRAPIHLDLEVTNLCQLKCPGCPSQRLDYAKGTMDRKTAEMAITFFGGKSIKFNWRGEPTLCPFLEDLIAQAKKQGYIDLMLNTNGVLLDRERSERMLAAGLTTIAWSLDSSERISYERLRPGARYDEVMTNLKTFLDARDRMGLTDECYVRVQRIGYPNVVKKESDEVFIEYFRENYPGLNAVATNHYKDKSLAGDTDVPSQPCAQPWQRIVMDFQGYMGPCCEMNRFRSPLGQFPEDSIKDVWHSDGMAFLRACHMSNEQNKLEACKRCMVTKAYSKK